MTVQNAEKKARETRFKSVRFYKNAFVIGMLAFPLAQFAVFYVYMNGSNIIMAFQSMDATGARTFNGFNNFATLFRGYEAGLFLISLRNCLILFFTTLIIGFPLNMIFSFYLYKKKLLSGWIRVIVMLPTMVSGIVMTLLFMKFIEFALPQLWEETFKKVLPNLIRNNNSAFPVQIFFTLWLGFSSSLILYSNAMASIDGGIIEAAKIDGITPSGELLRIVIPLIFPTVSTFMITGVAGLFTASGALFLFYGLNGVPEGAYLTGYYMFQIAQRRVFSAYPVAAAASLVITAVSVPITLAVRRLMDRLDPMGEAADSKPRHFFRRGKAVRA